MLSGAEFLFWGSLAIVAYTYAGYPLLLILLVWLRPSPAVSKGTARPSVSLIVVAHNEERHIAAKISDCLSQDYPSDRLEIWVASDGSSDRTEEIVRSFTPRGVRLAALPGPRGKPTALNQVVPRTGGSLLVLTDARQRLGATAVSHLVENLADSTVGAVSGELYIEGSAASVTGGGVGAYWRFEKWIRRLEAKLDSTVGVTGALYAVRREVVPVLPETLILDDVAVPMAAVAAGHRVVFEPESHAFDTAAPPGSEFWRKVRTLAGNLQLVWLYPQLLTPWKNRLWWQFVSHKLLRLAVPWALVGLFGASAALGVFAKPPQPGYSAAALGQTLFYTGGLAGILLESRGRRVRILSLAAAFVLLNAAALVAFFQFTSGRSRATWKTGAADSRDRGRLAP